VSSKALKAAKADDAAKIYSAKRRAKMGTVKRMSVLWTDQKREVDSSIGLRDSLKISDDTLGIDLASTAPPRTHYPHFS
jgi:hypothetical protein